MRDIEMASESDREQILELYQEQKGREFCAWDEGYPSKETIDFDLSRDALFIMRENGRVIAAITLDLDENVEKLDCWNRDLLPGGELSRVAVACSMQNKGIAREMMRHAMRVLKERGYRSAHFLVNKYNKKAISSYATLGFDVVGECHMYDQDYLCYEKALSADLPGRA